MTMKTPYELAEDIETSVNGMMSTHELMVTAIEADRAQRADNPLLVEVDDCEIRGALDEYDDALLNNDAHDKTMAVNHLVELLEEIHDQTVRD